MRHLMAVTESNLQISMYYSTLKEAHLIARLLFDWHLKIDFR